MKQTVNGSDAREDENQAERCEAFGDVDGQPLVVGRWAMALEERERRSTWRVLLLERLNLGEVAVPSVTPRVERFGDSVVVVVVVVVVCVCESGEWR